MSNENFDVADITKEEWEDLMLENQKLRLQMGRLQGYPYGQRCPHHDKCWKALSEQIYALTKAVNLCGETG